MQIYFIKILKGSLMLKKNEN